MTGQVERLTNEARDDHHTREARSLVFEWAMGNDLNSTSLSLRDLCGLVQEGMSDAYDVGYRLGAAKGRTEGAAKAAEEG